MHRRHRHRRRRLGHRRAHRASCGRIDRRQVAFGFEMMAMAEPLHVACIGIGWWSDVLADAIKRSSKVKIVACFSRSEPKRAAFAAKYGCRASPSYEAILKDAQVEAIINTTPNDVHLETTRMAAEAGKHVFLDKPIANSVSDGRKITKCCRQAGVVLAPVSYTHLTLPT